MQEPADEIFVEIFKELIRDDQVKALRLLNGLPLFQMKRIEKMAHSLVTATRRAQGRIALQNHPEPVRIPTAAPEPPVGC